MYLEVHRPLSAANDTTLLHLLDPFGICSQSGLCIYLCVFIISVFVCVYLLLRYTGQCLLQTFPLCCILLTYFDQDFCNETMMVMMMTSKIMKTATVVTNMMVVIMIEISDFWTRCKGAQTFEKLQALKVSAQADSAEKVLKLLSNLYS